MNQELSDITNLSHYRILEKLGAGGMGEVYLAEDTSLGRKVALKLLPAHFTQDQDRVRRFIQEAKAASALNHPNIITIYEIGQAQGVHYIATEFIDGSTLRQQMSRGKITLHAALDIATQTASALVAAHQAGIVHRDIKPENVMLRRDGIVRVLDFGLAKLTESSPSPVDTEAPTAAFVNTETGAVMGTPRYMSPEQASGQKADARTDLFSLGVMLYEMLSGRAPFRGQTASHIIVAILEKEPEPLARAATGVPAELERIVTKALVKDREERYQSAKDLLIDLKRLRARQELEAELARSASAEVSASAALATDGEARAQTTAAQQGLRSSERIARTTSSAEYLMSEIKRHKVGAFISLAAMVIVTAAIYFFFQRSNQTIDSLAVLPFANVGDPNTEYLSDGITESLINSLSQLANLNVIARTSVFHYKGREVDTQEVGQKLGVQAVLTGRVVQRGDSLSISVELVEARSHRHLWGEHYNRKLADILTVQEEIARGISEKLRRRLSAAESNQLTKRPTENTEAYQLYLKGLYYSKKRTDDGWKKAVDYFNQAIETDPTYALAYAGLAQYYQFSSDSSLAPSEAQPKAEALVRKALALDETLAEAHMQLAAVKYYRDWNWSEAEREYRRAIELNPNYADAHGWYGCYFAELGRFDEASVEIKRALELDPLSLPINIYVGWNYYYAQRYDQAIEQYGKTLELDPNYAWGHYWLGLAYDLKGESLKAIAALQKARQLDETYYWTLGALGHAYAASGNRAEAKKVIDELKELSQQRFISPYTIAWIYTGLGDRDQAFAYLDKAYEIRADSIGSFLKVDPILNSLRSDPRFTDLLRRVGHKL